MNGKSVQIYAGRAREFAWKLTPRRVRPLLRGALTLARSEPAVSTGVAWGLIMLARLFLGGAVGMADNFDGHRLMCQLGVAPHPIPASQPLWAYLTPRYDSYTWYGESCSAGGSGQPYLSTEYFPLLLAKLLTGFFGLPGALDLRMLGIIFALCVAAAIGWTVSELPGPMWARVLIASGIGLAVADSAVAPYFISPFSEPAAVLGMLLLIPALLRLLGRERVRVRDLALVAAVAAWTIGAKTQMASLLLVVVPVLLLRPSRRLIRHRGVSRARRLPGRIAVRIPASPLPHISALRLRRRLRRRLRPRLPLPLRLWLPRRLPGNRIARREAERARRFLRWAAVRTPALVICALLVGGTVEFQRHQPRWLNEITRYDDVFTSILGHSPNVQGDLRALHLPADFAPAAGSSIVADNSAATLPDYPRFVHRATFGDILAFYATHPLRLFGVADRGLAGVAVTRPSYLGNYQAGSSAAPYQQDCRLCIASAAFTLTEPFRWVVIPGLWIGATIGGVRLARRRSAPARARGVGVLLASVSVATIAQFWTVMLTEGDSDLEKHMLPVVLGTMLLGPLVFAAFAAADQIRPASVPDAEHDVPLPRGTADEEAADAPADPGIALEPA